jgi:hypothetical protein
MLYILAAAAGGARTAGREADFAQELQAARELQEASKQRRRRRVVARELARTRQTRCSSSSGVRILVCANWHELGRHAAAAPQVSEY